VCLDTAHAFHAGHDIRSEAGLEGLLSEIDQTIGLDRVPVVHANDSKTALGSHVDRHQHIGKGRIGADAFRRMLAHPQFVAGVSSGRSRAFILETPIDAPGDDRRNVRTLWSLAGVKAKQAPRAEDGFTMLRPMKRLAAGPSAKIKAKSRQSPTRRSSRAKRKG
jgi:deoxyribonuclease-4